MAKNTRLRNIILKKRKNKQTEKGRLGNDIINDIIDDAYTVINREGYQHGESDQPTRNTKFSYYDMLENNLTAERLFKKFDDAQAAEDKKEAAAFGTDDEAVPMVEGKVVDEEEEGTVEDAVPMVEGKVAVKANGGRRRRRTRRLKKKVKKAKKTRKSKRSRVKRMRSRVKRTRSRGRKRR